MLPIHIFQGPDQFVLVRAGTTASRGGTLLAPARARALLEDALRRKEPRLIRELAAALNMPGADADQIAARGLERLTALEGEFVMVQAPRSVGERTRHEKVAPEEEAPPPEPIEEEAEEEEPPPEKVRIRVSLFFDGTANNRANTREREAWEKANAAANAAAKAAGKKVKKFKKTGSYENAESNISRLETIHNGDPGFDHSFSVYVEGIGTTDGTGDTGIGLALGTGGTGVPAKVTRGINELIDGIRGLGIPKDVIIELVDVDTFGFSRGAAAARHCVHVILTKTPLKPRIEQLGYTVSALEVHYVGLYDTVASYGVAHYNDTRDLDLDAVTNAKRVVQFAAAEEHRKNFRLTDIRSVTGKGGVGTELYFPGVHSDVGGGYTDNASEEDHQILDLDGFSTKKMRARFEREVAWLEASGWYIGDQIHEVNWWNELKVTKTGISADYNRIPLRHMAAFAAETGLQFDPPAESKWAVPGALAAIDGVVAAHVAAHTGGGSTAARWLNDNTPPMRALRNGYLHFSASYGNIANPPQWSAGGAWTGRRERIVQAG